MATIRWFIASMTVMTLISWTALYYLPTSLMAVILGVLLVFAVGGGLIKAVLITFTPTRR